MPVSSNDLGLKNTQQSFGIGLMIVGAVVGTATIIRLLIWRSEPFDIVQTGIIAAMLLFSLRRFYVGICSALSILVDDAGPARIERDFDATRELLLHRRVWTYQKPKGLIGRLCHRFVPRLAFLTPPYRPLLDALAIHSIAALAAVGSVAYFGPDAVPVAVIVLVAGLGRILALREAGTEFANSRPAIDVYENHEHLTQAGNPIDLYNHLRMKFERLREAGFQNRIIADRTPVVSTRSRDNRCDADLIVETQPMPLEATKKTPRVALILDAFGVLLECGSGALLLYASLISANHTYIGMLVASVIGLLYGSRFLAVAQAIHYSFRFRSDLVWLHCDGTYMLNTVAVGGGLAGLPSAEAQAFKSDLHMTVRATRLVTECALPTGSLWLQLLGTTQPAEKALHELERYIVSAQQDAAFSERLDHILHAVSHFSDDATNVRTPQLGSDDVQGLIKAGIQVTQLTSAAQSHGTQQGRALGSAPPAIGQPQLPAATKVASPVQQVAGSKRVQPVSSSGPPPPPPRKRASPPTATPANQSIDWSCGKCRKQIVSPTWMAGKPLKCSGCGHLQNVPPEKS